MVNLIYYLFVFTHFFKNIRGDSSGADPEVSPQNSDQKQWFRHKNKWVDMQGVF